MLKPVRLAEIQFQFLEEIGLEGKNSQVYKARDDQLGADLAVKQVSKETMHSVDEYFAESQALYATAHPNVVQVQYACFDELSIYIALPFYEKGSLKRLITGRHMTLRRIITVACQVLSGLHNVHSKGLIHFDIKPDNILLTQRGEAVLSDFGLAKQVNYSGIAVPDRHYTPNIPPEALVTNHFDRTFDIYQFGLLLYRVCTGDTKYYKQLKEFGVGAAFDFERFKFAVTNGQFPDRSDFPPHLPQSVKKVIKKCLAPQPSDRYQSAMEVSNALSRVDGKLLDWQLVDHDDKRVWSKKSDGREFRLTMYNNGSSKLTRSVNGNPVQRIAEGSRDRVTNADIHRLLGAY
jgi:serine/threonine protein kinase